MSYLSFNSSDPNCIFNNNFNEDFIIPPNATMGLVNMKFQPVETVFDKTINTFGEPFFNLIRITLDNNTTSSNLFNVVIPDIYTEDPDKIKPTNFEHSFILPEIATEINNTIDLSENKAIGMEFRVDTGVQPYPNKINFKFETFPYVNPKILLTLENITYVAGPDEYKMTGGITSYNLDLDNSQRLYSPFPFTKGNGFFRIRIDNFTVPNLANTNSGFTIALVEKDPVNFDATLEDNIIIGINLPYVNHNYRYIDNDTDNNTTVAPANILSGGANNDVVELRRNGGKYQAVVYQANGVEHLLFEKEVADIDGDKYDDYTYENLYPVIFFGGNNSVMTLSNPRVHLSPYDMTVPYESPIDDSSVYGTVSPLIPPKNTNSISIFTLEFLMILKSDALDNDGDIIVPRKGKFRDVNKVSFFNNFFPEPDTTHFNVRQHLGRFLGFQIPSYRLNYVHSGTITGNNEFIPTFHSKMYFLQCQNLELDSYTSVKNGKQNILLPLPIYNRFSNKFITYEPNNVYSIKLNNINPIPMRNFRFRLLDDNLEKIEVVRRSDMTVVINKI